MAMLQRSRVFFNKHGLKNLKESPSFIQFQSICNSSPRTKYFVGEETFGDYTKGPDVSEVFKRIWNNPKILVDELYNLKKDFGLYRKEISDNLNSCTSDKQKGEIDMLFTFDDDSTFEKFKVVTDKTTIGGFSTASFVRTQYDSGLFTGVIDHRLPKDGKCEYSGFAGITTRRLLKSFGRVGTYFWEPYSHLVLKIRGDGRPYYMILGCPGEYDVTWQDQFHYPIYTRGGPYWQLVKIPFSNFYFTARGKIQDHQYALNKKECSRVGISVAGGEGPFKLEIDYIGLENQPFHKHISPYERYYTGKNLAT